MTLCIAAVANGGDAWINSKIVFCSDLERTVEGIGASETEYKFGYVRPGWPVMVAGNISKAGDLSDVYSEYLDAHFSEINEFNLKDQLRIPAHLQKERLVDEYLRQTYGFSREYFYGTGMSTLPETFVSSVIDRISRIKLDASLLIGGFVKVPQYDSDKPLTRPFLAVVDDVSNVSVSLEYEFAAIGSGDYSALSSLYRRKQDSTDSLERTLYNVYEANRLSENVPGVGKEFLLMHILHPDGRLEAVSADGYEHLGCLYTEFGPQEIDVEKLSLQEDFFTPLSLATIARKASASGST
jgi:hypothetical protein